MGHLVDDLLTLARLEGSPRPAGDRGCASTPLLGACRGRGARSLRRAPRDRLLRARQARDRGDEAELQSAFGNLVNNAVRYTPDGGRIEVGWQRDDNGAARSRSATAGSASRATPAAAHRALLSRRPQPLARIGRHRPRPGDRQARHAAPRRRARHRQRARQGLDLPARLPGLARARCRRRAPAAEAPTAATRLTTP